MRTGADLIATERMRQITEEGWTAEHDDEHTKSELLAAAMCYANTEGFTDSPPPAWPWSEGWWKPTGSRVRDLVKAGALIAAEIDRLQRTGATP